MLNDKTPLARVTRHSRSLNIKEWLKNQKELTSGFILIVIETDQIMIHSVADGGWLGSIDWGDAIVIFTEAQNVGRPYKFRGLGSAFIFLDAFLLHHFLKTPENPREIVPLVALAGGGMLRPHKEAI